MNIAHIEERSFIYGPGCRFVIWTQGCSLRCEGCWNESMWDFSPKTEMTPFELFDIVKLKMGDIEGITLLGGEPLDQYDEVTELLELCVNAGLSSVLFTGYEMEEINGKNMSEILDLIDILITGRYDEKLRTLQRQWIGSTNQEIHFLGEKYKDYKIKNGNYLEVAIKEDGSLNITGFPDNEILLKVNDIL